VRRKEDEGNPDQPVTHVIGDRCKDWFCPHCSQVQGPKLRAKLIDRLLLWRRPFMLTFTIDRDLFESAEQAFLWVTQRRAISRVMKAIKPHLHRADWFCIVEFQVDGGWPHWHVLVDADHVPIHEVRKAWRRCVPKDRRHLIRPSIDSMGIVRYSKPEGFANARHAGLYASKYLVKYPEDGFPDWVMQARYRIRRYTTSRGFWGVLTHRATPNPDAEPRTVQRRTHAARLKDCCTTSSVYAVREHVKQDTGELFRKRNFMGRIPFHGQAFATLVRTPVEAMPLIRVFTRGAFVSFNGTWADLRRLTEATVVKVVDTGIADQSLHFVSEPKPFALTG